MKTQIHSLFVLIESRKTAAFTEIQTLALCHVWRSQKDISCINNCLPHEPLALLPTSLSYVTVATLISQQFIIVGSCYSLQLVNFMMKARALFLTSFVNLESNTLKGTYHHENDISKIQSSFQDVFMEVIAKVLLAQVILVKLIS